MRAEVTLHLERARPVGEWPADRLVGLVNPDGEHPLMVRVPAERPFFLDVLPVTWSRWLRRREGTVPPGVDPLCPRTGVTPAQARAFAEDCGKRLPTEEELRAAWGPRRFPWGDAPDPRLGRSGPPRYDRLPEVGEHPPNRLGLWDLGAWLWQITATDTLFGGRRDGAPEFGVPWDPALEPVGFRLAQDG